MWSILAHAHLPYIESVISMPTNVDLAKYGLQRAAALTGSENVHDELRLFTRGKFIYFVAGGQLLVPLNCSPEDNHEFFLLDSRLIWLN